MKLRKILFIVMTMVLVFGFSGCGDDAKDDSKVDMAGLRQSMLSVDTTLPEMTVVTSSDSEAERAFAALTEFDYGLVEDFFYAYATKGTPEEIAVIKLKDKMDAVSCMDKLKTHINQRISAFESYDPDNVTMLKGAITARKGDIYIVYIVSSKAGLIEEEFNKVF